MKNLESVCEWYTCKRVSRFPILIHRNDANDRIFSTRLGDFHNNTDYVFLIFQVLWYRDTLQLDMNEWRITDDRGNRYTLRLRKMQKTDFGNYSCVADNGLGKSKRSIEVTGKKKINLNYAFIIWLRLSNAVDHCCFLMTLMIIRYRTNPLETKVTFSSKIFVLSFPCL